MKISAVVFDFGGVMTTSTMPQRVIALAKEKGIDWNVFVDGFNAHRLDYDAGHITLGEMYALIWGDAGLSVPDETTAAFMKADDESWCYRNERTLEWMKALKARGLKIGILTNMAPKFAREHFEPVFADFIVLADAMVISGDEGIVKPQREIYDLLRSRINLPAEELCFIDDAEKNVNGSRVAGWNAIRFVTNDQVEADFEKFILEPPLITGDSPRETIAMKLSKKNAARQSAISRALASGKGLGGLLVGLATAVVGGCSERSPSNVMGDYPAPQQPKNTVGETRDASVMGKMILKDEKSQNCTTNAVNEFESEAEGGIVEVIEE